MRIKPYLVKLKNQGIFVLTVPVLYTVRTASRSFAFI